MNGYHAKWNLKKQSVPAIAAGSAFSFVLETDLKEYPEYIGERNIEGLGRISIANIKDCCYCIDELDTQEMTNKILHLDKKEQIQQVRAELDELEPQLKVILQEKLYKRMQKNWYENIQQDKKEKHLKISAATLGRVKLMLMEAVNECRGEDNEAERIYFNLKERIQSVKREEVRDELTDFLSKLFGKKVFRKLEKEEEKSDLKISIVKSLIQDNKGNVYKEYTDLCDWYGEEAALNLAYELWHYCLQEQLVLQKYLMKEKEMTEV